MRRVLTMFVLLFWGTASGYAASSPAELNACANMVAGGLRPIAEDRVDRFLGKVHHDTALCRGGDKAVQYLDTPWVDWANYWATGDESSQADGREALTLIGERLKPDGRGIDGSLMDLEYQRIELIKFNLFDNYTYETYIKGLGGKPGSALNRWDEMRLDASHPHYQDVGGDGPQLCQGELIRYRTLSGICNDIWNPKMGATGTYFSRNVQFESTFPRLYATELQRARHSDPEHGKRLDLLKPDPQLISREPETFDLLITDQTMPGMTGLELARQVASISPESPVILCSGYRSVVTQDKVEQTGIKILNTYLSLSRTGCLR